MADEIKGSLLITSQPSSPKKEETEVKMISEDRLELFLVEKCMYIIESQYLELRKK